MSFRKHLHCGDKLSASLPCILCECVDEIDVSGTRKYSKSLGDITEDGDVDFLESLPYLTKMRLMGQTWISQVWDSYTTCETICENTCETYKENNLNTNIFDDCQEEVAEQLLKLNMLQVRHRVLGLLQSGVFADVCFYVGKRRRKFRGHRAIICTASPILHRLIEAARFLSSENCVLNEMCCVEVSIDYSNGSRISVCSEVSSIQEETGFAEIYLPEENEQVFKSVLDWIYGNRVSQNSLTSFTELVRLMGAAERYSLPTLLQFCQGKLQKLTYFLSCSNAYEIYECLINQPTSFQSRYGELRSFCVCRMLRSELHVKEVRSALMTGCPATLTSLLSEPVDVWRQAGGELTKIRLLSEWSRLHRQQVTDEMLLHVDPAVLTEDEILTEVHDSQLYSATDILKFVKIALTRTAETSAVNSEHTSDDTESSSSDVLSKNTRSKNSTCRRLIRCTKNIQRK